MSWLRGLEFVSHILAQAPPGMDEALRAASNRGWEAVILVVLIIGGFSFFAFMFRHYAEQAKVREERLSSRVMHMEDMIRDRLFTVIDANAQLMQRMLEQSVRLGNTCDRIVDTMERFDTILSNRPCMALDAAERMQLVEAIMRNKIERHKEEKS